MIIKLSAKFDKMYSKLSTENQYRVDKAINIFSHNPFDLRLKNHPLKGDKLGIRSFSAGYDLRILYKQESNHEIAIMLMTGTHSQVY